MTTRNHQNKPIRGVYRPGLSSIDQLKKTGVGRQEIFAELMGSLEESAGKISLEHVLFTGPPGIGKTHLMKLLNDKIARSRPVMDRYRLIVFPAENYRITSTEALLLEMLTKLAGHGHEERWSILLKGLEDASSNNLQKKIINEFKKYNKDSGRRLLVLFENFDSFFMNPKKNKAIVDRFCEFLENCGPVTFIGTASTSSTDKTLPNSRPFNLFKVYTLSALTREQTQRLVENHLKYDNRHDILSGLEDLEPKIQALHELTGGNPRLILLLYELLTDESGENIKSLFEDVLDRVTPYYNDRIRSLTKIDRAFLATLASLRTGVNSQSRLASRLRISPKQCSSIVNRLIDHGLIESKNHPRDKRSKVFRIKEGFFDLWLAISQLEDPKRFLPFLGEFLEKWYSDKVSRERKRQRLWASLQISEAGEIIGDVESTETLLTYLSDIGPEVERCQNQLELAFHFTNTGRQKQARKLLKSVNTITPDNLVFNWVTDKIESLLKKSIANGFYQQLVDLFDCWKYGRSHSYENLVSQAITVSSYFSLKGEHDLNICFLSDAINLLDNDACLLPLYARIAGSQEKWGQLDQAVVSWKKALAITDTTGDLKSKGTTLNNLSQVYQDQGSYSEALAYLEQALEILQKINDYDGQSTTLNNIATVYFAQGYYEKALEYFEKTLSIIQHTNDLPLKAITLSNISFIYKARGEYKNAIEDLEQSLSIMRKTGNRNGEATTLINISQAFGELGDMESCYRYFQPALQILDELKEYPSACNALFVFGNTFWQHGSQEMALSSWWLLQKIAEEHQLSENLNKLKELMSTLGIDKLSPSKAFS